MTTDHETEAENDSARNRSTVVFGEVLYDCFEDGRKRLGGAPFNVAWGLAAFGADPLFVSAVGQDEDGDSIMDRMQEWDLSEAGLQESPHYETGRVEVAIEDGEPRYEVPSPRAWDFIEDEGFFADRLLYHGSLALRGEFSAKTLAAIRERSRGARFYDVNLRPPHTPLPLVREWLEGADWAKLNLDELAEVSGRKDLGFDHAEAAIDEVRDRYGVGTVLLTAGTEGARIRGGFGEASLAPAPEVERFVDSVGAGDAFTAVTLFGILNGWDAAEIVGRASEFAAKVCGLSGATTTDRDFYHYEAWQKKKD